MLLIGAFDKGSGTGALVLYLEQNEYNQKCSRRHKTTNSLKQKKTVRQKNNSIEKVLVSLMFYASAFYGQANNIKILFEDIS